jgi:glycosyltransferase involved in cell wall biosynthesis
MMYSVVIPLYNKALHIGRALRSVLNQTNQDFEVIVVNDGSSDIGREIVENIHDPRIRLIDQSNQGVSAARNRGIEAARSEYVAFLDADDEWLPDFLDSILVLMRNFPGCGAYATSSHIIRPDGKIDSPLLVGLPAEPWTGIIPNFFELFQAGYAFNASSTVVPKQVLLEVDGFPAGVKLSEDVVCWINIAIRYPIAYNPKPLIIYHQDATNRTNLQKHLAEEPYIKIIREAISNDLIPMEQEKDALEFISQRQIFTARDNVMEGKPAVARQVLARCSKTRNYKKMWLWWRFWASFPAGWPEKFMVLKQKLTKAG